MWILSVKDSLRVSPQPSQKARDRRRRGKGAADQMRQAQGSSGVSGLQSVTLPEPSPTLSIRNTLTNKQLFLRSSVSFTHDHLAA